MVKVESAVPLYKQIVHDLVSRIESGVYSEGDKLPTETELMEEYGVSRITVRSAIKELEDADIVERTGEGKVLLLPRRAMPMQPMTRKASPIPAFKKIKSLRP